MDSSSDPTRSPDRDRLTKKSPSVQESDFSLNKLNMTFSQLAEGSSQLAEGSRSHELPPSFDETPRAILEAMLFMGNQDNLPLTSDQAAGCIDGVNSSEVATLVQELNQQYEQDGSAYHVVAVNAGYRMQLRKQFGRLRDRFYGRIKRTRLSQAAIDVLAIVAYNQPTTQAEIDRMRGKSSGALLSQLVRRQLLAVEQSDAQKRPRRYCTTQRFLGFFGLENLEELPRSEDFEKRL
jgi:segregation and condensation protein B